MIKVNLAGIISHKKTMQVCIHRGTQEIGGSCVELISSGKRLIIDLGLPLNAESNDKKYLPAVSGFDGNDDSLLAILISHPHLDHFGLLAHVSDKIPVIIGADARRILTAASPFLPGNCPIPADGPNLKSEVPLTIGPFKITPFLIDHSAYDAYSLLIEAEGKRIFYSGDLRMHGRKSSLTESLMVTPPRDIDVLMLEGSTFGRLESDESYPSEQKMEEKLVEVFAKSTGLVLMHTSSQNIDRIVSIFRACKKTEKRLIIDLYTAAILEATGNKNLPQSSWSQITLYIPQSQRIQIKNNKWFELLKSHSKNRIYIENLREISADSVLLFRPLHIRDLERADLLANALYVYSQWEGYWDYDSNSFLREWISKHNIPKVSIHTSGHASPSDLKRFADALKSAKIVPIHTFMPEKYFELFNNVQLHADGDFWEV
jgi:ribonuclease J